MEHGLLYLAGTGASGAGPADLSVIKLERGAVFEPDAVVVVLAVATGAQPTGLTALSGRVKSVRSSQGNRNQAALPRVLRGWAVP